MVDINTNTYNLDLRQEEYKKESQTDSITHGKILVHEYCILCTVVNTTLAYKSNLGFSSPTSTFSS